MRAVVVYESMYGNTRVVAEAIADGLRPTLSTEVAAVTAVDPGSAATADLLVVGGPTHVHGMSRPSTRKSAAEAALKPDADVTLEPHAQETGLREWLAALPVGHGYAAAFDTRIDLAPVMTGRASKPIARRLRRHGRTPLAPPASFLVDKQGHLRPEEQGRARAWGERLAVAAAETALH